MRLRTTIVTNEPTLIALVLVGLGGGVAPSMRSPADLHGNGWGENYSAGAGAPAVRGNVRRRRIPHDTPPGSLQRAAPAGTARQRARTIPISDVPPAVRGRSACSVARRAASQGDADGRP